MLNFHPKFLMLFLIHEIEVHQLNKNLKHLTNLKILKLEGDRLITDGLYGLVNLEELYLYGPLGINDFNLINLEKLRLLRLSGINTNKPTDCENHITTTGLKHLINLRELIIEDYHLFDEKYIEKLVRKGCIVRYV